MGTSLWGGDCGCWGLDALMLRPPPTDMFASLLKRLDPRQALELLRQAFPTSPNSVRPPYQDVLRQLLEYLKTGLNPQRGQLKEGIYYGWLEDARKRLERERSGGPHSGAPPQVLPPPWQSVPPRF